MRRLTVKKIGVLGAGTWGMALARMLCNAGNYVLVWSALEAEIDDLQKTRRHPKLPDMVIPKELQFTKSMEEVCTGKDILLFAVPSVFVRSTTAAARPFIPDGQVIVDVAKGIEPDTLMTMSEVIRSELEKENCEGPHDVKIVALSGPTHAEEVALDLPTTIVSACEDEATAEMVQDVFMGTPENVTCMRVYTNTDVTNCYRFIARLNMGGGSVNVAPSIEIYRNYTDRVPQAELRFKVGDNIVYSKTIDDLGGVDYPFRISYGASRVRAIQLGYLPYSVTFQFGDLIYTYKSSVDYSDSDFVTHPEYYAVKGAYIEYGKHYESTSNIERAGSMFVINTTVNYMSNPFLYGVPHEVDPKEANFSIDGLLTPYVNNPANDWTAFKIVPGENIAFASSYGIANGYFHATLKYREVFV